MKFLLKENLEENDLGIMSIYDDLISSYLDIIEKVAGIIYTLNDLGVEGDVPELQSQISALNDMMNKIKEFRDEKTDEIQQLDESKKKKQSAVQFLGGGSPLQNMKMFNHLNDVNYAAFCPDGSNDVSSASGEPACSGECSGDAAPAAMGEAFHLRSDD